MSYEEEEIRRLLSMPRRPSRSVLYTRLYDAVQRRLDALREQVRLAEENYATAYRYYREIDEQLKNIRFKYQVDPYRREVIETATVYVYGVPRTYQEAAQELHRLAGMLKQMRAAMERVTYIITAYEALLARAEYMPEPQAIQLLTDMRNNLDRAYHVLNPYARRVWWR